MVKMIDGTTVGTFKKTIRYTLDTQLLFATETECHDHDLNAFCHMP